MLEELATVLAPLYSASPAGTLETLKGDASSRSYQRFRSSAQGGPASVIVMQWPELDANGTSLDQQARAFIDVRSWLATRGIDVPAIHAVDLDARMMSLEDLGDVTFEARLHSDGAAAWEALYTRAIDLLAELHVRCAPPQPEQASIVYQRRLDARLLRWELDHFREWGIEALHPQLSAAVRADLDAAFDAFTDAIVALPDGFVHRDYQSRNLMWATPDRLVVIDFQDAFIGPAPYDLVALLCDSYVELGASLQQRLLARYAERRGYGDAEHAALRRGFDLITVQRKLKDAGRFVFIDRVRHNPSFLQYYGRSLGYVERALLALTDLAPARALHARLREVLPGFPECPAPASHTHMSPPAP
jgi:aminoglycoside/choline kinase family phosphotransferase